MLKLTIPSNGQPRWVAAEHILLIEPPYADSNDQKAGAFLTLAGLDRVVAVKEKAEDVAARCDAELYDLED